ncbi:MAG: hypothetical protein ACPGVZ_01675 [Myxococcota bacterium]
MEENAALEATPLPRQARFLRFGAVFLTLWAPFFLLSSDAGHPISFGALALSALVFAIPAWVLDLAMKGPDRKRQAFLFAAAFGLFLNIQARGFDGIVFVIGVLALSGLFWGLRAHLPTILVTVMATTMLSAWILPTGIGVPDEIPVPRDSPAAPAGGKGLFLHLILDEMVGPAGIPEDVPGSQPFREDFDALLDRFDFTVLPQSHSEHNSSKDSMAAFLNFESTTRPHESFHGKRPYILSRNAYFEWLSAERGPFHVLQSDYMEFCAESPVPLASCTAYRHGALGWLDDVELSVVDEFAVVFGVYANSRGVLEFLGKRILDASIFLARAGLEPPRLLHWDGILAPANGRAAFARLEDAVVNGPSDGTYFAHVILPHSPYVVDANCAMLPAPLSWKSHTPRFEKDNTAEERIERYRLYWGQARCAMQLFAGLLERLEAKGRLDDATILVQGDHGSRIAEVSARASNRDRFRTVDFWDSFGALLAYRGPGLPDAVPGHPTTLSEGLADFARAASSREARALVPAPRPEALPSTEPAHALRAFLLAKDDEERVPLTLLGR